MIIFFPAEVEFIRIKVETKVDMTDNFEHTETWQSSPYLTENSPPF
jgi:hypothetical protein